MESKLMCRVASSCRSINQSPAMAKSVLFCFATVLTPLHFQFIFGLYAASKAKPAEDDDSEESSSKPVAGEKKDRSIELSVLGGELNTVVVGADSPNCVDVFELDAKERKISFVRTFSLTGAGAKKREFECLHCD